jgi:hypothetical protein
MLQFAGFWMALTTFLGIWWGHVGVRWIEARSPGILPPIIILTLSGLALNIYSLFAPGLIVSGVTSIFGITLLWDAFEVYRQQKRVLKGHSPANPKNPRHAAILAAGKGITEDLLDREPQGKPVTYDSAISQPVKSPVLQPLKQREYGYEEVEV